MEIELPGCWLYPGGGRVMAPDAANPRWRGPDGSFHTLSELLAGQPQRVREVLIATHADAICEVVLTAAAAKGAGRSPRASAAAVSRLCAELIAPS